MIMAITQGHLYSTCQAHSKKYLSDENVMPMINLALKAHYKMYIGDDEDRVQSFMKRYDMVLEKFPMCYRPFLEPSLE